MDRWIGARRPVRCGASGRFREWAGLGVGQQLSHRVSQVNDAERLIDGGNFAGQLPDPAAAPNVIEVQDRKIGKSCRIRLTSSAPVRPGMYLLVTMRSNPTSAPRAVSRAARPRIDTQFRAG